MEELSSLIPILIVDDNPENLLVMEAVLRRQDYEIVEAVSGMEALEAYSKKDFAVVLLDIQMPGMDGYEVARRMKDISKLRPTPIIFITASTNDRELVEKGYQAGGVDYLFKPIEATIVRSKVSVFAELYKIQKENLRQSELLRIHDQKERDSLLELAMDAVVGMNQEGNVIYWNQQAEKSFGWQKYEVLGKPLSQFIIPPLYRNAHKNGLKHFLESGEGPILNKRIEVNAIRRDGHEFPVELAVIAIKVNNEYTFSAFIRDISDKKLEELKMKLSEENLKKAIHARDEFISVCSHELKTPLTSMLIQFQLAKKLFTENNPKAFEKKYVQKRIDLAIKQLGRMGRLIENMLDVSRLASGKLTLEINVINLETMIREILEAFQDQFDYQNINVSFIKKTNRDVLIEGDSFRLEQVLSNLLTNALKYGLGKPIEIILEQDSDCARLSVIDHGIGIKDEYLNKIFDRYERAVEASEISGLGLGLFISQQIVKAHKGHLEVKSIEGTGSKFTLELPLLHDAPQVSI